MKVYKHEPLKPPKELHNTASPNALSCIEIDTSDWEAGHSVFLEREATSEHPMILGWGVILNTRYVDQDDDWIWTATDGRTRIAFSDSASMFRNGTGLDTTEQVMMVSTKHVEELCECYAKNGAGPCRLYFMACKEDD